MIKYSLRCDADHEFEGWFRSSADYDEQAQRGLLECPICGANTIEKAIMAPAVARSRSTQSTPNDTAARRAFVGEMMREAALRARAYVEKNFENVGAKFPEEARRIHYGETPERGIYGEANPREVRELIDEGVPVAAVPGAPKTDSAAGPARVSQTAPAQIESKKPAQSETNADAQSAETPAPLAGAPKKTLN